MQHAGTDVDARDAAGLASGVYLYRLNVATLSRQRKQRTYDKERMFVMIHTRLQKDVRAWTRGVISVLMLQGMVLLPQLRAQGANEAVIYLDSLRQVIRGFGGANIVGWNPGLNYGDMTPGQIQTAFGNGPGELGFTIMRLRIPPDSTQFRINVPSTKLAESLGATVIATPWTPPAWMKTSGSIIGGSLGTNNYAAFAAHLKAFADTMASNGAPVYAVSVQNEPDFIPTGYEGCGWNGTQFLQFMRNNAPAVGIPVFMPEAAGFNHTLSDPTLNDSVAASHVAFIGGHIYGATPASYPLALSKGKELWMTEYLINSPGSGPNMDTSLIGALATAKSINDCMNANMSAYVWWYIVRYYGPIDDGTKGGVAGSITKKGYVMSQFARFVRPGYMRVLSTIPRGSVYVTAYKPVLPGSSSNSKFVIVAVNMGSSSTQQTFRIGNIATGTATVKPYVTSRTKDCEQQSDMTVSYGTFTATLADSSVTTFVGGVVVSVDDEGPRLPQTFELFQNYPNPFNPITVIRFGLPVASRVSLNVFDLLGRNVASLADGMMEAGYHNTEWNARAVASGLYFYRLEATTIENPQTKFVETRKMLLLR
jgi:glucuronoarabinoxylan endo-1,4-beta-xylanase